MACALVTDENRPIKKIKSALPRLRMDNSGWRGRLKSFLAGGGGGASLQIVGACVRLHLMLRTLPPSLPIATGVLPPQC